MPKLVKPANLVVPFLEWLHARGREMYLRPVREYVQLIWLRQDHLAWWLTSNEALHRAFDDPGELLASGKRLAPRGVSFDTSLGAQLAEFHGDVARELQVLEEAIALARAQA